MNLSIGILITILCSTSVICAPPSTTESLVVVPDSSTKEAPILENSKTEDGPKIPKIYSMEVDTNVTNRFATTLVTSKVKNLDEKSQEATFSVVLPETAYISGFVMEIDGEKYKAYVQEKEEAKKTYDNAVSSGIAAGHVALNARDSNRFTVSVNIEPQSKAIFYLTYEELLKRQNGQYEIVINLHPGQPIKDLDVQVHINESRPLTFVKAPSLRSGNEISKNDEKLDPKAEIERIDNSTAKVTFKPDIERQKEFAKNLGTKEGDGLAGQFVVQYDVERDPQGGEILVSDGYFVHFFAPSDQKPLPKHVVFVLDTSGSMFGSRIVQLKEAMKTILDQLMREDTFNIVEFNSLVKAWNIPKVEVQYQEGVEYIWGPEGGVRKNRTKGQTLPEPYEASEQNVKQAKNVIETMSATGGTDIDSALNVALKMINEKKPKDEKQPIIMFLTDGEPTEGETNTEKIISKVSKENTNEVPIFSLSFGQGADRSFLEKLSLRNQAFARHIYEGADASLQLESFYKYISSPLLSKVNFKYVSESVTKTNFPILFDGSELVVAGTYKPQADVKIDPGFNPSPGPVIDSGLTPAVSCWVGTIRKEFKPIFVNPIGSLEKHWAYLSLQQILDERDAADDKTESTKKALDIALKYSFVTPVSSLVVVKPNNTKAESNLEDASSGGNRGFAHYPQALPGASFPGVAGGSKPAYAINSFSGAGAFAAAGYYPLPHPPSTPFALPTTQRPLLTTQSPSKETFDELKKDLPWLVDVFEPQNGTLKLSQGQFLLDTDALILDVPECLKSPLNGTGTCVLLKECPQVHRLLTDLPTYTQYFCPLHEWAGVCCPVKPDELPKLKNRKIGSGEPNL